MFLVEKLDWFVGLKCHKEYDRKNFQFSPDGRKIKNIGYKSQKIDLKNRFKENIKRIYKVNAVNSDIIYSGFVPDFENSWGVKYYHRDKKCSDKGTEMIPLKNKISKSEYYNSKYNFEVFKSKE